MKAVSYAEVHSALAQLVSRKEPITLSTLRQALGNRGSMSTLSKHLQRWKTEQALTDLPSGNINPAPEPILAAVQGVWQQIFEKGQQELVEQKETFEKQRALLEEASLLAKNQAEQANKEAAELRQKMQQVLTQCQQLEEQSQQATHQQELAQQRAAQAEKQSLDLQNLLTQTMAELRQYQDQLKQQYQKDKIDAEQEKERLKKDYQALLEQEKNLSLIEKEKWQKAYFELQERCAQAETIASQGPSLEHLSQLILQHQEQSLCKQESIKQQLINIQQALTKTSVSYITSYANRYFKGYC